MADQAHGYSKEVGKSAEKRMRQWAIGLEVQERVESQPHVSQVPEQVHPYVAISRDTGAGATELAKQVADTLGWDMLGREVLNVLAEKYHLEESMVRAVDETKSSWLIELFGKWISQQVVTQTQYVKRLGEVLLMAARHGSTVFVGRGAQCFLPRERGLVVQVIAPIEKRLERVTQREGMGRDAALKYLKKRDRERRDFLRENFECDVTDPHVYDLIINLEHLDRDTASDLIVRACKRRFQLT
jgi:cytidylate kinase